jgi:hypothetical protein
MSPRVALAFLSKQITDDTQSPDYREAEDRE